MTRPRRFVVPEISLVPASSQPMYLQLSEALARAIRSGFLLAGTRLPSTRAAARLFHVSRTTVLTAYETLSADCLIESAQGSGTRVRGARMIPPVHVADWKVLIRDARYPARVGELNDPDGNVLYVNQ